MTTVGLNLGHDAGLAILDGKNLSLVEFDRVAGIRHVCGANPSVEAALSQQLRLLLATGPIQTLGLVDYSSSPDAAVAARVAPVLSSEDWAPRGQLTLAGMMKRVDALTELAGISIGSPSTWIVRHHWAHAHLANALVSGESALVLVLDGAGALGESGLIALRRNGRLVPVALLSNQDGPRFGMVYESLACAIFGNQFATGKLMGLSAHGRAVAEIELVVAALLVPQRTRLLTPALFDPLPEEKLCSAQVLQDGVWYRYDGASGDFRAMEGVSLALDLARAEGQRFPSEMIIGGTRFEMSFSATDPGCQDLAATLQRVFEQELLRFVRGLRHVFAECDSLAFAGGCALNILANSRIRAECGFANVVIPSCCDDSGVALGAAIAAFDMASEDGANASFACHPVEEELAYAGPPHDEFKRELFREPVSMEFDCDHSLIHAAADALAGGKVLGWIDGRCETGPRALGHRSMLANPLIAGIRKRVSEEIKAREWFRPVAASCPAGRAHDFFTGPSCPTPTMLHAWRIRPQYEDVLAEIAHADLSVRLQTVDPDRLPVFHSLLEVFGRKTGMPVLLNTSLNLGGMPIANSCAAFAEVFNDTQIDALVIVERKMILAKRASAHAT